MIVNAGIAIVLLSVVVIVGYTGQLSLGQSAMAGMGALIAGRLVATQHWPFALALLVGIVGRVPPRDRLRPAGGTHPRAGAGGDHLELGGGFEALFFQRPTTPPPEAGTTTTDNGLGKILPIGNGTREVEPSSARPTCSDRHQQARSPRPLRHLRGGVLRAVCTRGGQPAAQSCRGAGSSRCAPTSGPRRRWDQRRRDQGLRLRPFGRSRRPSAGSSSPSSSSRSPTAAGPTDPFKSILLVAFAVIGGVGFIMGSVLGGQFWPGGLGSAIGKWISTGFRKLGGGCAGSSPGCSPCWACASGAATPPRPAAEGERVPPPWVSIAIGVVVLAAVGLALGGTRRLAAAPRRLPAADRRDRGHGGVLAGQRRRHGHTPRCRRARRAGAGLGGRRHRTHRAHSRPSRTADAGGARPHRPLRRRHRRRRRRASRSTPGEVVGLIGPNGAGKTTMIDAVTGFVSPAQAVDHARRQHARPLPGHRAGPARRRRSFQSLELFEDLTVLENNIRGRRRPRDAAA